MNNRSIRQTLSSACRYLRFLSGSHSRYAVHSPFVYDLIEEVLRNRKPLETGHDIEQLRAEALKSELVILKRDYGSAAGHRSKVVDQNAPADGKLPTANEYHVRVKHLARNSTLPARRAKQLHRLVKFTGAKNVLEIGTSLGFTTAWLAKAIPGDGRIVSLEGCPETMRLAENHIKKLGLEDRVSLLTGRFEDTLPGALQQLPGLDLAFIDGHHLKEPTLDYFSQCLEKRGSHTVIVLDDIHHSPEMTSAWEEIRAHPEVIATIDLFRLGFVFFREGLSRQHFVLRY